MIQLNENIEKEKSTNQINKLVAIKLKWSAVS